MPNRPVLAPLPRRPVLASLTAAVLLSGLAAGGLAACAGAATGPAAGPAAGTRGVINGTVTYRERIALSPDALLEVALFDVTDPDGRVRPIAKQLYTDIGQVPLRFAFLYDPAAIAPDRSYAVVARILEGERPVFLTSRHAPVLTGGAGDTVTLVLARASGG